MEHISEKKHAALIPMPHKRRFYFSWLLGGEECYTSDEMQLRQTIRELRMAVALPEEIQDSAVGWFREDKQALLDIYEGSWFFSACYKPNENIKSDHFASNLLRHDVVSWPELGKFVLELGDYLMIRNQFLPTSHYNQPMNYVLMDLRRILERLASVRDEQRLLTGLKPVRAYIAGIERLISPIKGSDHVFLTDMRTGLYQQEKIIAARVSRQSIHREIEKIKYAVQNLAQQSHAILHFSFAKARVNAHPHIELLQENSLNTEQLLLHPVNGATRCMQDDASLHDCPFLHLSDIDKNTATQAYRRSIAGVKAFLDFDRLLAKALAMSSQTGEVYSLFEMHAEFGPILQVIADIAHAQIKDAQIVIEENQAQYQQAVQTLQASNRLSHWFGSARSQAKTVLVNQNALALFKIDIDTLTESNEALQVAVARLQQHFLELNHERAGELVQHARETIGDFFKSAKHWQDKYASLSKIKPISSAKQPQVLASQSFSSMRFHKPVQSMPQATILPGEGSINPGALRPMPANGLNYSYLLAVPLGFVAIVLLVLALHKAYRYCVKQDAKDSDEKPENEASL